jgi:predicted nucleic acid-binding protein
VIVLDASVLIAHLSPGDVHRHRATDVLLRHADRPFTASVVTMAEVLTGPERSGQGHLAARSLARLGVARVPVDVDHPERLAALRRVTRLRLPDCCVLLAAETVDGQIATFDIRLAESARDLGRHLPPGG